LKRWRLDWKIAGDIFLQGERMKRFELRGLITMVLFAVTAGCGRPPAGGGGPPGEYSVSAVVAPAKKETIKISVQLVGSLKARDAVDIVSEINGIVAEILFTDGQIVEKGDVLIRLNDAKLKARKSEANARLELAKTNFKRSRELRESDTISQQEFDQMKAEFDVAEASFKLLEEELKDSVIEAPFAGITGERMISAGGYLTAGQTITRLVQMDPLEAEFRVPEVHIGKIKPGQKVVMHSVVTPGIDINGEVFFINPSIDVNSRTVLVKAIVSNSDLSLKPGQFGKLDLVLEERDGAIIIPESCIRYAGDQASVVVMNSEGKAEFRNVNVGQRFPGRVEITAGLEADERVVVEGYQKMGPGTGIMISPASEKYGIVPEHAPETAPPPEG